MDLLDENQRCRAIQVSNRGSVGAAWMAVEDVFQRATTAHFGEGSFSLADWQEMRNLKQKICQWLEECPPTPSQLPPGKYL